jgi:muramoyltetrapeptide carboxypeptidase
MGALDADAVHREDHRHEDEKEKRMNTRRAHAETATPRRRTDAARERIDRGRAEPAANRPRVLRRGDRVRLVLPASPATASQLARAAARVRAMGFDPVVPSLRAARGYLAGDDAARVVELIEALEDREAGAVMAVRGGSGCMRLLPAVDALVFDGHAPLLVGFSDITALQAVLYTRHRLVTLHAPMPGLRGWDRPSAASLSRTLTTDGPLGPLAPEPIPWNVLVPGRATGVLLGGNLALVHALHGTPWRIPTRGAVLYLEDVDESPHRIERMLLSLALGGSFDGVQGIVIGTLTRCRPTGRKTSLTTQEVLADVLGSLSVPVVVGFPAGHAWPMATLPLGVRAELDAEAGTLRALEPALR